MKTLNNYITEWKVSADNIYMFKGTCFIYKLTTNTKIKIFDKDWAQFKDYKDKVYINRKHVKIDDNGNSIIKFKPGTCYVEIKDIDNVTNCQYMFFDCTDLVEVPLFDTSKVKNMYSMFYHCVNLREVPLFNISKVKDIDGMFYQCYKLSDETRQNWLQIYDFIKNNKKK